jgi:hypothetical protein
MSSIDPKVVALRLDAVAHESLRQKVLRRDGWRCQSCGTMTNLEVHHQQFRSHSGDDTETNLITLCSLCQASDHSQTKKPTSWQLRRNFEGGSETVRSGLVRRPVEIAFFVGDQIAERV